MVRTVSINIHTFTKKLTLVLCLGMLDGVFGLLVQSGGLFCKLASSCIGQGLQIEPPLFQQVCWRCLFSCLFALSGHMVVCLPQQHQCAVLWLFAQCLLPPSPPSIPLLPVIPPLRSANKRETKTKHSDLSIVLYIV